MLERIQGHNNQPEGKCFLLKRKYTLQRKVQADSKRVALAVWITGLCFLGVGGGHGTCNVGDVIMIL